MIAIINTYEKHYSFKELGNTLRTYYKDKIISSIDYSNPLFPIVLSKYTYDKNMNLIKEEFGNGYWNKYEYDENNRNIRVENNRMNGTAYQYDKNGKLIHTYAYLVIQAIKPL